MEQGPSTEDLKSQLLWLSHAHIMVEAARVFLAGNLILRPIPANLRGVCHCQYHAVILMLVGYSIQICLKAVLVMRKGIPPYQQQERKYFHHSLDRLAYFTPALSDKHNAVLNGLTHYVRWAGRYPASGFGKQD
jgi:hypothetical protein